MQYIPLKERAKVIRALLKTNYPGCKFSVTANTLGEGDIVNVQWELGPSKKSVENALKAASIESEMAGKVLMNNRNKLVSLSRVLTDEAVSTTMDKLMKMYSVRGWPTENVKFLDEAVKLVECTSYFRDVKQAGIQ